MDWIPQDYNNSSNMSDKSSDELTEEYKKLTVEPAGLPEQFRTMIIECSICKEKSCTERMDVSGYRDAFGCGNWCGHEDQIFIPTKLFINVNMINKLCCNCVDNLINEKKLVYYSVRSDIIIPIDSVPIYRTEFLREYYEIICIYLDTLKDVLSNNILSNDTSDIDDDDISIYFYDKRELKELSYKFLSILVHKVEQVIETILQEFIIRKQMDIDIDEKIN